MRLLTIFEHVSLDGVIQSSDDGDGFAFANWTGPYRSPAGLELILSEQGEAFDLLLGRRTYDIWSSHWPMAPRSPMADRLNAATKFVATHRLQTLSWGPHRALGPDLVAAVRSIKAQQGPPLVLWGSSTLTSVLLEHGLADALVLAIYPVLLGVGKRLFAAGTAACTLELVSSAALPTGIVVNRYRNTGPLRGA